MGGASSKPKKKQRKERPPAPPQRRLSLPPLAFANARSKEDKVQKAFDAMDGNKDGKLDPAEVTAYLLKMGYGRDECERFVKLADVSGHGCVDFNEFHAAWGFLNAFRVSKHTAGEVVRKPGSVDGKDLVVEDCKDCAVKILDVFVRDCKNCTTVSLACQQLRTRDCADTTFYLYAATEPIVESSQNLSFAPFNVAYDGLGAQFEKAGFDPAANLWYAVHDFSSPDAQDESHWVEQPPERFVALAVEVEEGVPCGEQCPVPRDARAPIPADSSMRGMAMHK
ncbi:hypothetical protein JL722_9466 [Aureococcus anophagefferens]|nr:hypothetical protein JL722_9466 [Aureococcus anophagefferens]